MQSEEVYVEMDRDKTLEQAIAKINKAYGEGSVIRVGDSPTHNLDVISTGAITLDEALGIHGVPRGRITEISGPESAGKTTLALHIIANVQKAGGTAAIIDVEHAVDLEYAARIGVQTDELLLSQPDSGEQALEIAETLVRGGIDCIVLDSVAALVPQAEIDGEMADMQMGLVARLMSKACRKLVAPVADSNTAMIFINQIREKIGGYGNSETTSGGRALKYASSVRIDLRKKETIKAGDSAIEGITVVAKVVKNKLAAPHKVALFDIYFNHGIDYLGSLIDVGLMRGHLVRAGSWFSYSEYKVQGKTGMAKLFIEHPELQSKLEQQIKDDSDN